MNSYLCKAIEMAVVKKKTCWLFDHGHFPLLGESVRKDLTQETESWQLQLGQEQYYIFDGAVYTIMCSWLKKLTREATTIKANQVYKIFSPQKRLYIFLE